MRSAILAALLASASWSAAAALAQAGVGTRAGQDVVWTPETRLTFSQLGDSVYEGNQRRVAVSRSGTIHVVWYIDDPGLGSRRYQVYYKRRNPGSSWTRDTMISADLYSLGYSSRTPSIAVDTSGVVYVAWVSGSGSGPAEAVYCKVCVPAGTGNGGWSVQSGLLSVSGLPITKQSPTLAATPDGHVHACWLETSAGMPYFLYREQVAGIWQAPQTLEYSPEPKRLPTVAGNGSGDVYLTWYQGTTPDIFVKARVGSTWLGAEQLTAATAAQLDPSVACDPLTGTPHVVWVAQTAGDSSRILHASRSGAVWAEDTVSEAAGGRQQHWPQLCFTADGTAHAIWIGHNPAAQLRYASRAVGEAWSAPSNLTNASFGRERPAIAASDTAVAAVWLDLRDGNPELYAMDATPNGTHDVGVEAVLAPVGVVDSGTSVTPTVSIHNFGSFSETFDVRLLIGSAYDRTASTPAPVAPGTSATVTFPDWPAEARGAYVVRCSTTLALDATAANDTATARCTVQVTDAVVVRVVAPPGTLLLGSSIHPELMVANLGSRATAVPTRFTIRDSTSAVVFAATEQTPLAEPGETLDYRLSATWTPSAAGRYNVVARSELAGDQHPENDSAAATVQVVSIQLGWRPRSPMPRSPSSKAPKAGAWLVFNPGDGMVYSAKGNNTRDFYMWNPQVDSWYPRETVPPGASRRRVKKGSNACTDGNGHIYAVKGANTTEFYRFDVQSGHWQPLPDVPREPSGGAVKSGTDLAYAVGRRGPSVYLLKGPRSDFLRYDIARESWYVMANAPGNASPDWPEGSWLTADGAGTIYAHKAKYSELWTYSASSDSWLPLSRSGIPIQSQTGARKKAKDGSSGAYTHGLIYALKGGGTNEFYRYNVAAGEWQELEPVPRAPNAARLYKVKAGGDLTGCAATDLPDGPVTFTAIKGAGSDEVWTYSGIVGQPLGRGPARSAARVDVRPSHPLADGICSIGYSLPARARAVVRVYDVAGRCVASRAVTALTGGTCDFDTRQLAAGIYLVRLAAGGRETSSRLIVTR